MTEGIDEITGKRAVPLDIEQKAAEAHTVTEAQQVSNQVMRKVIATKMQQKIDSDLLPERKVRLQSGFNEVRKKAIAARTVGSNLINPTPERNAPTKKNMLKRLGF